jgi:hypothetical protein
MNDVADDNVSDVEYVEDTKNSTEEQTERNRQEEDSRSAPELAQTKPAKKVRGKSSKPKSEDKRSITSKLNMAKARESLAASRKVQKVQKALAEKELASVKEYLPESDSDSDDDDEPIIYLRKPKSMRKINKITEQIPRKQPIQDNKLAKELDELRSLKLEIAEVIDEFNRVAKKKSKPRKQTVIVKEKIAPAQPAAKPTLKVTPFPEQYARKILNY